MAQTAYKPSGKPGALKALKNGKKTRFARSGLFSHILPHIRSVKRWKQDYQHSTFTCSVDVDNADNKELAKKYGVRAATINAWKKEADAQWSIWHNYGQFGMNTVNKLLIVMDLRACASRFLFVVSGIILFPYDVKWVDNKKKTSPYRASKF